MNVSNFLKLTNKYFDGQYEVASEEQLIHEDMLTEMANVRGKDVEVDDIDFSFYFSKKNSSHGIRLKVVWNRERMSGSDDGYIEMHGDYKYVRSSSNSYKPKGWEVDGLRYFCKKWKALFAAVWEQKLDETDVRKYFEGNLTFPELMQTFEGITDAQYREVNKCRTVRQLEETVRKFNIYNMND